MDWGRTVMEYALIIATLAAGSGWLLYLDKSRALRTARENVEFWYQSEKTSMRRYNRLLAENATLRAKLSRNTPRAANGRFVKGGEA